MVCTEVPPISVSHRGSVRGEDDCTVVWVSGEHDIATKASLAVTVAGAAKLDNVPVVVDLSAVTFMDASTAGAIVGSRNRLRSRGQLLMVRAPSPRALRVLELCGLAHLVNRGSIYATGAARLTAAPKASPWVRVPPRRAGQAGRAGSAVR